MKRLFASSMASFGGLSACVLTFAATASASAAIIGTATKVRNPPATPFTAPDAALGAPWVGYELGVHSTAGEIIAAMNVSISGPLHQRWNDADLDGVFESTTGSLNKTNGDSHLHVTSGLLIVSSSENNPGTGSPLPSTASAQYGVGTYLEGAWGVPGSSQSTSADLAYLVIPEDRVHDLRIDVQVANPSGDIIARLSETDFFPDLFSPPVVGDLTVRRELCCAPQPPFVTATLPASDDRPLSELTWNLESFSAIGNPGPLLIPPTVDPATGLFTWNPVGAGLRVYTAVIRATDVNGLSDTGILTIIPAPEPTSLALVGCALAVFAASARRKMIR